MIDDKRIKEMTKDELIEEIKAKDIQIKLLNDIVIDNQNYIKQVEKRNLDLIEKLNHTDEKENTIGMISEILDVFVKNGYLENTCFGYEFT